MKNKHLRLAMPALIILLLVLAAPRSEMTVGRAAEGPINLRTSDIFFQGLPSLTKFSSRDGLPVNSVMTVERDKRGYIWFGTQDGAAYFNGHNLTVVNMPNRAASNYIFDILATDDESIWFGTNGGGLHRLKNDEWTTFDTSSGLASPEIRVLLETVSDNGSQVIWTGTRDGLSRFEDGAWTNFDNTSGLPDTRVRSLLETTGPDGKKTLWIGTYGGIAVWQGEAKKIFDERSGLPGKTVFGLLESRNDAGEPVIWAGTNKGLAKFENNRWQTFEELSPILSRSVRALAKTTKANGTVTVWVGFDGAGVAYFENGKWYFLDEKDGLPNNTTMAFGETGALDGSIWISSIGAGVSRFERSNWRSFTEDHTLPSSLVFDVEETVSSSGESAFWFATYGGGAARFQNGRWTIFKKDDGIGSDYIQSLKAVKNDSGDTVLYAGTEKGLAKFENGRWQEVHITDEFPLLEVWNIRETSGPSGEPEMLLAASYGVIRRSGDSQTIYNTKNGLPDRRARDVLETLSAGGERTLWVATYSGGLAKLAGDKWTAYNDKTGFPANKIYSLAEIKRDDVHQLWVGTGGSGIAVFDLKDRENKYEFISTENSALLPSDTVYKIFQDSESRIYATTNKGVARITAHHEGGRVSYSSYIFTTEDGLPENECISGAGSVDSSGRIWVGTVGGAGLLDISREIKDTRAAPLFLENVLINGEKRGIFADSDLPHYENNLTFEYVMPTNFRESATAYRTQLVGLEERPSDWTKEPRREFTYVPAGNFVFKVWGRDAGGNISGPLEIPFSVSTAWWKTWWAILLYFLATAAVVGLIAFAIYRNRYLRMLEIERVRTRIATDLHDDVGSSLSKISILSEVLVHGNGNMGREAKESLAAIASTSREVVNSMGDMVWSINPSRDNLRDTIQRMRRFTVELLTAQDIRFTFDAPEADRDTNLDVDLRRQLYLVFKESLTNVVKYSNCTKVEIELKQKRDLITLRVSDNGDGFDPNADHHGNGLVNMRTRTTEAGGKLRIDSDRKGTTVILEIPRRISRFAAVRSA